TGRSCVLLDVRQYRRQRFLQECLVHPEIDLLALLARLEDAGGPEELQVVRDRGAREGRDGDDLPDVEPLARLEGEQDPLSMLVAQRREDARRRLPLPRD